MSPADTIRAAVDAIEAAQLALASVPRDARYDLEDEDRLDLEMFEAWLRYPPIRLDAAARIVKEIAA
jgi:hypothetical protein